MRVLILFVVAALAQKSPPLDAQGRPLEKPDKELFNAAIEAMKKLDIDPKEVMTEDKHLDTLKEKLPEDQYNAVVLMIKQRPPLPKGMPKDMPTDMRTCPRTCLRKCAHAQFALKKCPCFHAMPVISWHVPIAT